MSIHDTLRRYADIIVGVGANVQPGQLVLVRADLAAAPLVREIVRSAYQAGARLVDIWYDDEQATLARYQYAPRDSFESFPTWRIAPIPKLIDDGAALIAILSDDPDLLSGQPDELIATVQRVAAQQEHLVTEKISHSATNWTVAGAVSSAWARKVFPDAAPAAREALLWDTIAAACRLGDDDPVAAWRDHVAALAARADLLNRRRYDALHYRGPSTDLVVGLAPGHIWCSGASTSRTGITFVANLPTEEIFTMPDARRVDGVVRASRPLNLNGALVDDFSLRFERGRVVEVTGGQGREALTRILATDEGAARLGEVALVPQRSPIARSGMLFYSTLFDENAASHLAFGEAYRFTCAGAGEMDDEAFVAVGGNLSAIHIDFMVGSSSLDIDGVDADGRHEPLMRAGEWVS